MNTSKLKRSLTSSDQDVDNLKVKVQTAKELSEVSPISCSPIFVHTEKKTRLKELPQDILNKVNDVMDKNLAVKLRDSYFDIFDIFIRRLFSNNGQRKLKNMKK